MDAELRHLAADVAIRNTLGRYARAIDRLDYDLLRTCYHPDAIEDRGRYRGDIDGFVAWLEETLQTFESTWHLVGSPLIEVEGDIAWVESYCLGLQRTRATEGQPAEDRLIPCRYIDRFELRDGAWKIARRVAVYEPAISSAAASVAPLGAGSVRDRTDAAYLGAAPGAWT